ncbi:NAD(P)-binding protein [Catenaria anguillulae PL171]|uniref:NAD(P)-binding protein n=1 Tax=Catenaria anguillulae PL171 TaxID=765915 RepID=A0A1Y2HN48_9FUNG|nr:NAD(P)-binding protein [Catenaria anguillulae PL171]
MPTSFLGLENTHIFVTGASGGLGVALVRQLVVEAGARVTAHHNSPLNQITSPLALLAKELGPNRVRTVQASATDEDQVARAIQASMMPDLDGQGGFGHVPTVLVVCHGIWPEEDVSVADMDFKRWKKTLAVNLDGTFFFLKHWLRAIRSANLPPTHPNISAVLVGSTAAKFGEAMHADYAASKAAFQPGGLLLSLKNELVKIHPRARINTVAPGWIRTPMAARAMEDPQLLGQAMATSPLRKVSEPEDVGRAIMYLASGRASGNVTGTVVDVNAGMEGRLLYPPKL